MIKLRQNGGIALVLIIILTISLLGAVGYAAYERTKSKSASTANDQPRQTGDAARVSSTDLRTYIDEIAKYSIQYPMTWQIKTEKADQFGDGTTPTVDTTLTAPSGLTLSFYVNYGGKGGMCVPEPNDVPHAPTNACNTSEVIFAEKTGKLFKQGKEDKALTLTRIKHTYSSNTQAGKGTVYFSSLSSNERSLGAEMGAYIDFGIVNWTDAKGLVLPIDIKVRPLGESPAYFEGSEVKELEQILRSFESNS